MPLIGWTWYFLEIVFCKRKWEEDRDTVIKGLKSLANYPEYMWVSEAAGQGHTSCATLGIRNAARLLVVKPIRASELQGHGPAPCTYGTPLSPPASTCSRWAPHIWAHTEEVLLG